ncbi:MAG: crotonase [bacterium]|nr:MAG: crotonase [bacterium]
MNNWTDVKLNGNIGYLILDRAPANAINRQFVEEILNRFDGLSNDNRCDVIVISSSLPKFFAAGADIDMILKFNRSESEETTRFFQNSFNKIAQSRKLTIAAINGFALGGGFELALACDYRIAAEGKYVLGLPETTLGIIPGAGGTQRLSRLIGAHNAFKMIAAGRSITAKEALNMEILDEISEDENFDDFVYNFASKIAKGAIRAKEFAKAAILQGVDRPIEKGLDVELKAFLGAFSTEDAKEGLSSFIEKRKPNFKGR